MYGFKAFYNGKSVDVHADTLLQARQKAAELLKVPPKKEYMISVVLCEKDGQTVNHSTTEL